MYNKKYRDKHKKRVHNFEFVGTIQIFSNERMIKTIVRIFAFQIVHLVIYTTTQIFRFFDSCSVLTLLKIRRLKALEYRPQLESNV